MEKILTFIINEKSEWLLLKGSDKDPQFHKSFWYTVTGGKEEYDSSLEDTVIREVKEETDLDVEEINDLDWTFEYDSLGKHCIEYAYVSKVKYGNIKLNEENIDYKWCDLDEYIEMIEWWGEDKNELYQRLEAFNN